MLKWCFRCMQHCECGSSIAATCKICRIRGLHYYAKRVDAPLSTWGKSAHLFAGGMSANGNSAQCQRCERRWRDAIMMQCKCQGMVALWTCTMSSASKAMGVRKGRRVKGNCRSCSLREWEDWNGAGLTCTFEVKQT